VYINSGDIDFSGGTLTPVASGAATVGASGNAFMSVFLPYTYEPNGANDVTNINMYVDGSLVQSVPITQFTAGEDVSYEASFSWSMLITGLSAGSHTFSFQIQAFAPLPAAATIAAGQANVTIVPTA
jgi:predicted acylesterase/phospholipase RssA